MHEECENCEAGVLLESFWCKAIFRTPFVLLLYLHDLMHSIFGYRTILCQKKSLLKKKVSLTYCDYFQAFVEKENFFEKDTDKFLAEILLGVSNVCNAYTLLIKILKVVKSNRDRGFSVYKKLYSEVF